MACASDGARFVRRAAVARAVERRGLTQGVELPGRRAAADAARSTFDLGQGEVWAVLAGFRVLDYWNPGKPTPLSVALAGTMP